MFEQCAVCGMKYGLHTGNCMFAHGVGLRAITPKEKVQEMIDEFEEIRKYCRDNDDRISELETRIEHHSDMIYNKLQKKEK